MGDVRLNESTKFGTDLERENALKLYVSKVANIDIEKVVIDDSIKYMYSKTNYFQLCQPLILMLLNEGKNIEQISNKLKLTRRRVLSVKYK